MSDFCSDHLGSGQCTEEGDVGSQKPSLYIDYYDGQRFFKQGLLDERRDIGREGGMQEHLTSYSSLK